MPPELVNHPRYRVLKLLGQGGMGAVYLAEHLVMGRRVALKTIGAQFLTNREAVGRFHRRGKRAAAKLAHPNVVAAYDADQAGGLHFLVMEYVDGLSVADYARRKGALPIDQACAIVSHAAVGLQHAHEQGLIHRDVKPANLMLTSKGQVKVLDFGLAQFARQEDAHADAAQTASGTVLGTADYIAPEQTSSSRTVDIRADVYSLGCTLYYLLAGRVPFPDGTVIDKLIHHATDTPPALSSLRPALPPELVAVVEKMMAKRPEDRYQKPAEVVQALRPFTSPGRTPPVAPPSPLARSSEEKTQPFVDASAGVKRAKVRRGRERQKRVIVLVAGLAAALMVAGLVALGLIFSRTGAPGTGSTAMTETPPPARAVVWTGKGRTHTFLAPDHTTPAFGGILDFREVAGATPKEFHDWQAGLGPDFRVSFLSNRNGVGPPLFNGVAVRDRTPVPVRVFTNLTDDEAAKVGDRLKAEGLDLDYRFHCAYAEAGQYRHSMLWAPGTGDGYLWYGTFDFAKGKVEEERNDHKRPCALDAATVGDDRLYHAFGAGDGGGAWKAFLSLTPDHLLSTVEEYRVKGQRPDVMAPHWDGERFRFMLVVRDNPEPVDWRLQIDMTLQDYKKVSAEEKEQGRFPLLLTSYGDEAAVKYAALWMRYRILE